MHTTRSVHDNHVYACRVDYAGRRIVLHTTCRDADPVEHTDVVFGDVFAHQFDRGGGQNILFNVNAVDTGHFVRTHIDWFRQTDAFGWPPFEFGGDADRLIAAIRSVGAKVFQVTASYGLSGWVIAGSVERVTRDEPYRFD